MKTQRIRDKLGRGMLIIFWTLWHFLLVLFLVSFMQEQSVPSEYLMLLSHSVFCSAFIWFILSVYPVVSLTPDGVYVRILFRKRFYPWSTIKQAGVLYRMGKGFWYNEIVLLKSSGSTRRYKDKAFLLRNIGKTIPIPYSEDAKNYIIHHYGSLDFDFTDGVEVKT